MKIFELLNLLGRIPGDTHFKDIDIEVDGEQHTADSIMTRLDRHMNPPRPIETPPVIVPPPVVSVDPPLVDPVTE